MLNVRGFSPLISTEDSLRQRLAPVGQLSPCTLQQSMDQCVTHSLSCTSSCHIHVSVLLSILFLFTFGKGSHGLPEPCPCRRTWGQAVPLSAMSKYTNPARAHWLPVVHPLLQTLSCLKATDSPEKPLSTLAKHVQLDSTRTAWTECSCALPTPPVSIPAWGTFTFSHDGEIWSDPVSWSYYKSLFNY